ncbi:MAG: adenosine kinase [Bacteroidota bacterium]|nr:adenosine kinase [Candidatus Kapabacteria bacterium]MCS7302296.1 adenosine kinase [Candidatus Kapabacteria bacterium]MCX7936305.1 adenosine kinase [Chlorobiota bacterium]MDW8074413.1 adenosine kinase [Bacteroidota bacterium]MDW8271111.1 adenosine kinase [Bacteroidota bacterium]
MAGRIQLLGLGNALVDIEFAITEEELQQTHLRKSGMTLADKAAQQRLLSRLLTHKRGRLSSGGSAANTIVAFAQFGGKAGYVTVLGDDEHGDYFTSDFADLGIALHAPRLPGEATGTCIVLVTPDGERTMQTCLGVNELFNRSMFNTQWLDYTDWLYVEGYKLTNNSGAEAAVDAIFSARKKGVFVALSLSDAFVVTACRDVVEELLPMVDLLFCNDREASAYTGLPDSAENFKLLLSKVPHLVFTLGPQGSMLFVEGKYARIPAYPTAVVDTNGAGDMYAGAFLYGMLHRWDIERAGHVAARAAARIIAQYGARYHGNYRELLEAGEDGSEASELLLGAGGETNPKDATSSPS